MTIKVIKREAVFIPIKQIPVTTLNKVKAKLSFKFYSEKACKDCDNLYQRHNDNHGAIALLPCYGSACPPSV